GEARDVLSAAGEWMGKEARDGGGGPAAPERVSKRASGAGVEPDPPGAGRAGAFGGARAALVLVGPPRLLPRGSGVVPTGALPPGLAAGGAAREGAVCRRPPCLLGRGLPVGPRAL